MIGQLAEDNQGSAAADVGLQIVLGFLGRSAKRRRGYAQEGEFVRQGNCRNGWRVGAGEHALRYLSKTRRRPAAHLAMDCDRHMPVAADSAPRPNLVVGIWNRRSRKTSGASFF